jgi:hypothetical protein
MMATVGTAREEAWENGQMHEETLISEEFGWVVIGHVRDFAGGWSDRKSDGQVRMDGSSCNASLPL